jgi:hypothetical protein
LGTVLVEIVARNKSFNYIFVTFIVPTGVAIWTGGFEVRQAL